MLVQEDKAPAHSHYIQQRVFDAAKVNQLLRCGNSHDLNPIEPAWPYLKRATTKKGAPKTRQEAYLAHEVSKGSKLRVRHGNHKCQGPIAKA